MKPTLILSLLTLALGGGYAAHAAGLELPAASHRALMSRADATEAQLFRVDSDGHSENTDGEGCDEDDDEGSAACGALPAPTGTVTPPSNGLFGDGKAPIVKSN